MIPRRIHQTSRTKLLTFEERQHRRRIRRILPDWQLDLWDDADNDRLVSELFPGYYPAYSQIKYGVAKSDIARICYLLKYGGFYLDTDYKLLRPFGDDLLSRSCILPVSRSENLLSPEFRVCNSILASEPGHPFWKQFIDFIFQESKIGDISEENIEKITGPEGLTDCFLKYKGSFTDIYLPPRNDFHPPVIYKGLTWKRGLNSYGVHLCWGSWRSKGILKRMKSVVVRKITCF